MEVNFRGLNVAYFDVLEVGGRRYVLDSNSTTSKRYYWGFAPERFEIDIIELEDSNRNFDKRINTGPQGLSMVGIGIGLFLYRLSTSVFRYYNISEQAYLKLFLFVLSFLIAYMVYYGILSKSRNDISKRLPSNHQKSKIIFRNMKKKRQFHAYVFVLLHCLSLALYMELNNGTESGVLVLNGILAYLFIWIESGVIPLTYAYQKEYVEFESIEKNEIS